MTLKECIEKGFKKFTRPNYKKYNVYCFFDSDNALQYMDRDWVGFDTNYIVFKDDLIADDWEKYKVKVKKERYIYLHKYDMMKEFRVDYRLFLSIEDAEEIRTSMARKILKIE